mmetsp:Transcript_23371/g.55799  ORF Transcript_23371/g.55799 Transcript_23371/m.55799 type:complete len:285 (+) Transcript_23371:16-870(+)
MSIIRVIWKKISTLWPFFFSVRSIRSSSCIFPDAASTRSSVTQSPSSSTGASNRNGWLQHLRICIIMLSTDTRGFAFAIPGAPFPRELSAIMFASVPSAIALLYRTCSSVSPAKTTYTRLSGSSRTTSALSLRRRKGSRIACSFETMCEDASWDTMDAMPPPLAPSSSSKLNQDWKVVSESKMSGRMKLSSDHSSERLFCKGVPDSNRRFAARSVLSSRSNLQSLFFRRCPSSTVRYFQLSWASDLASFIAISNDVITTGRGSLRFSRLKWRLRIIARSSFVPW